jgi:hypothetical protein
MPAFLGLRMDAPLLGHARAESERSWSFAQQQSQWSLPGFYLKITGNARVPRLPMLPKRRPKSTKVVRRASSQRQQKLKKLFQKPAEMAGRINQVIAESLPRAGMGQEVLPPADEISETIAAPGIRVTTNFRRRSISIPCVLPVKEPAESAAKELRRQIQEYQTTLPPGKEVVLELSPSMQIRIEKIQPEDPQMLILIGTLIGSDPPEQVRIVQHVSQLNIRLRSIPVRGNRNARKVTGFGVDFDPVS